MHFPILPPHKSDSPSRPSPCILHPLRHSLSQIPIRISPLPSLLSSPPLLLAVAYSPYPNSRLRPWPWSRFPFPCPPVPPEFLPAPTGIWDINPGSTPLFFVERHPLSCLIPPPRRAKFPPSPHRNSTHTSPKFLPAPPLRSSTSQSQEQPHRSSPNVTFHPVDSTATPWRTPPSLPWNSLHTSPPTIYPETPEYRCGLSFSSRAANPKIRDRRIVNFFLIRGFGNCRIQLRNLGLDYESLRLNTDSPLPMPHHRPFARRVSLPITEFTQAIGHSPPSFPRVPPRLLASTHHSSPLSRSPAKLACKTRRSHSSTTFPALPGEFPLLNSSFLYPHQITPSSTEFASPKRIRPHPLICLFVSPSAVPQLRRLHPQPSPKIQAPLVRPRPWSRPPPHGIRPGPLLIPFVPVTGSGHACAPDPGRVLLHRPVRALVPSLRTGLAPTILARLLPAPRSTAWSLSSKLAWPPRFAAHHPQCRRLGHLLPIVCAAYERPPPSRPTGLTPRRLSIRPLLRIFKYYISSSISRICFHRRRDIA